jgi:hypothetical protein
MTELAQEAWRLHHKALAAEPAIRVTRPSAPILYFGDLDAYRESPVRVVTVGVNPSGEEFPRHAPWSRFACGDLAVAESVDAERMRSYLAALNEHFRRNPYTRWFNRSYERVLNGMNGSYYGNAPITALHTDVCSPLATTPTWRLLQPCEKQALAAAGVPLWHRLVEALQPRILLASVSAQHFARITLEQLSPPEVIYRVEQKRPYEVNVRRVRCGDGEALLLWAGASTTPFQPINDNHKRAVGAAARGVLGG